MIVTNTDALTPVTDPPDLAGDVWILEFKTLPSDIPAAIRVRALLKRALRDWKLKCVAVRGGDGEVHDDGN